MRIQQIIFPKSEICNEWRMYFQSMLPDNCDGTVDDRNRDETIRSRMESNAVRAEADSVIYDEAGETVTIAAGENISLETYFNSFSIGKWKQYTEIDELTLELHISGEAEIHMYRAVGETGESAQSARGDVAMYDSLRVSRECIDGDCIQSRDGDVYRIKVNEIYDRGVIYPVITAKTGIKIYGGEYTTESLPAQDVDIALGICTFKREDFVTSNVAKVIRDVIANDESPLCGHVQIYISDNGQTLDMDDFIRAYAELSGDEAKRSDITGDIHLFANRNAGGAGGFTRTMIESLFRERDRRFSHIILMDDDIILDCRVLERTYNLLRFVREKYQKAMIGGSMFELDYRFLQFEAGATFGGIDVRFYNKNWDMRFADTVSCNEVPNPINYSGWWYSVIPSAIVTGNNLPIPLFIHYDDIEYGIRNDVNGTILINGICVWHPQGANKAPISMNYYDVRNMQIANAGRSDELSAAQLIFHMKNRIIGDVIRYRYDAAERVYEAIDDFYKGPEYFMSLDPIENHKRLMSGNYIYSSPEEDGVDISRAVEVRDEDVPRWWYIWDAFCWLLPPFKKMRISAVADHGLPYMARQIYFYDKYKKQGFMVKRDYGRAWKCFRRYFSMAKMIRRDHDRIMREWADARAEYTSLEYWEKYLGI